MHVNTHFNNSCLNLIKFGRARAVLLAAACLHLVPVLSADPATEIGRLFDRLKASDQFSGAALIASGDKVIYQTAIGFADPGRETRNSPDTAFRTASVTKGFTAVLILQAVERGELKLNSSLADHFPGLEKSPAAAITLGQLLSHTSGLPDFAPRIEEAEKLSDSLVRHLREARPRFTPGSKYEYCNVGYTILGTVLEKAKDSSYAGLLRQRVLKPAGMTASYVEDQSHRDNPRARGCSYDGSTIEEQPDLGLFLSAGGLVSTTGDLWRFDRALADGKLLSLDSRTGMKTPVMGPAAYGCLVRSLPKGDKVQIFQGGMPGASTVMVRVNGGEKVVILLANRSNLPVQNIARQILKILLTPAATEATGGKAPQSTPRSPLPPATSDFVSETESCTMNTISACHFTLPARRHLPPVLLPPASSTVLCEGNNLAGCFAGCFACPRAAAGLFSPPPHKEKDSPSIPAVLVSVGASTSLPWRARIGESDAFIQKKMSNNLSLPGFRSALTGLLCLCLQPVLTLTTRAAVPWSKLFDPDLTVMEDPTIKQFYSDDFSRGFVLTGVSDIPGFSTGQSTAIGARFDPDGALLWGAFMDAGFGLAVSRERVVPLEDTTNFFAGYVIDQKARIGVYSGGALAKQFGYEFNLRPTSDIVPQIVLEKYAGDIIGVAQHLGTNSTINVMLFDKEGTKLSDKDYSGFVDPGFGGRLLMLHRFPDQSGFLLVTRLYLMCLNNDGTVRWVKSGFGDDRPLSIAPDGSMLFTAAVAAVPGFPDGGTFMLKLNSDGSFAWARVINGFVPVTDLFILGRNPVYDGTNIWMTGGTPDPNSSGGVGLDGSYLGLMRLDGSTGDIIAQGDLSFEDREVYLGEFAAWTGSHVLFAIESTDPVTVRRGHLLKMDGNFANPELRAIRADLVETTRVSHDAATGSLLYTWSAFNGSVIHAISMDAATLTPVLDCDLIGPVSFQFTNSMRTATPPPGAPPIVDAAITVTAANTALTSTDLPVVAMTLNEFDLCSGDPQPPASPVLRLAHVGPGTTLNLTLPSETGVNYEILFGDSMTEPFELIETLPGTGGELTYPIDVGASAGGYYLVRAIRESE